jgi:hypothetical protein
MSRKWAFNEIKAGRLKTIKIGNKTMVTVEEAERYLAERVAEAEVKRTEADKAEVTTAGPAIPPASILDSFRKKAPQPATDPKVTTPGPAIPPKTSRPTSTAE